MKVLIITSSPNKEGLTAACAQAAKKGVEDGKGTATTVCLNDLDISKCHACNNGWGTCNKEHVCQVEDDFQDLHATVIDADAFIAVTPVYWGEMSESAKAFFDRLRRCEASIKTDNNLEAKPVICIAAAGGSGNGAIACLYAMERLFMQMHAERFDMIPITRKSREHMLDTIRSSAEKMVLENS
jgi:multimeric flavodoxin WrbA